MTPSETSLVAGLRAGDPAAYRRLFDVHHAPMLRLAERLLPDRSDAEDVVQESFVQVYRRIGSFRGESALSTWLYRIVVNACLQTRRRRDTDQSGAEALERPLERPDERPRLAEARDERQLLDREIDLLPERQRAVFCLAVIEEQPLESVAAILDIAPGTARFHLSEARRRLRERLEGALGADVPGIVAKEESA